MEEKVLSKENAENFSVENTVEREEERAALKACANEVGNDRSRELEEENMRLRGELACAKAGIPKEIAEDIISIAANACANDTACGLEETVKEVYERICSAVLSGNGFRRGGCHGKGSSGITTGIRSEKNYDEADSALRRACGLKG
ncbi:MAG: hypothetical protein K2K57_01405 [Oscillospiraceae bacterium]|nr:hypothetical protein [Oscillospiraceae bacterium]